MAAASTPNSKAKPTPPAALTGAEKVAVLLLALGKDRSAKLLKPTNWWTGSLPWCNRGGASAARAYSSVKHLFARPDRQFSQ